LKEVIVPMPAPLTPLAHQPRHPLLVATLTISVMVAKRLVISLKIVKPAKPPSVDGDFIVVLALAHTPIVSPVTSVGVTSLPVPGATTLTTCSERTNLIGRTRSVEATLG
jgi:hypothetical protein